MELKPPAQKGTYIWCYMESACGGLATQTEATRPSALSKPFRWLMSDEFLSKWNWDGNVLPLPINTYVFFFKNITWKKL